MQETLVLLKPDALRRCVVGEIITRLEKKGLSLKGAKMLQISRELARKLYVEHAEKSFYPALEEYITSGPVMAMIWSGPEVVNVVRLLIGPTDGIEAPPGTIRGDYCLSGRYNLIHASDSEESAAKEIPLFFTGDHYPF